ncbi:hypothetical protein N7520_007135 [Penicillium odoratum]|uniref:uncharacterized protein n=1 Tax=Penicillium odoratum TaxID=1167516 RepID=UPI00254939B5|nr:uncharacterized protein N7520_007135 [Penicillium odoratum]KAJ5759979.1 hypothetical protein N7520_007135 [Penicillium odoratum]
MSDDEDYYDWEEEYLYEDAVPDLVDELAASSWYEAALYEDPGIEVEDYFSDWDYYSDDYHDDDPTVAQSRVRAKTEPKTKPSPKKKKGRAHTAAQVNPLKLDIGSFQGVVWKTDSLERDTDVSVQIYEPGQLDKVAFLQDWREIFKSAQPALDKSRLRKRRVPEPRSLDVSEDDEILNDADQEDSEGEDEDEDEDEDAMSDVDSTDQSGSLDAGEASNTTPEPGQSPKVVTSPKITVEIPVKRGRKRKAEAQAPVPVKEIKCNLSDNSTKSRSKRLALSEEEVSSGPVRRSTRQKK